MKVRFSEKRNSHSKQYESGGAKAPPQKGWRWEKMRYIISDIHGCFVQYQALLDKINFSKEDELYVLGDAVDRGPDPIRVLQDMMKRPNVHFILGNHDYIMYMLMKQLAGKILPDEIEKKMLGGNDDKSLPVEFLEVCRLWLWDGGEVTAKQFLALSPAEQTDMLHYLKEAAHYELIFHDGKEYRLVHAGIANFDPQKELMEYNLYDFIEEQADYSKRYYPEEHVYLVTGHTPTFMVVPEVLGKPEVYRANGHIALDCGCVFGGRLAAFCVETEEVVYVEG